MRGRTLRLMLIITGLVFLAFLILQPISVFHFKDQIAILFPRGIIALKERNLLFILQAIMLIVIIPVFILTFIFSWKYNSKNPRATYDPDLVDNVLAEFIWWGIPIVLTAVIAVITWQKTFELDPYKPLEPVEKTLTIQVVALQWKWLFIYPDEKIATVNFVQFPKDVPVHFEITADAPMNSFWIPHLGGQIYAMPKMKTELHLIANETGDFRGSSANLSGEGFAGMHFIARASSLEDYQKWVASSKESQNGLSFEEYTKLATPSQNVTPVTYQLKEDQLFNQILMKYSQPPKNLK